MMRVFYFTLGCFAVVAAVILWRSASQPERKQIKRMGRKYLAWILGALAVFLFAVSLTSDVLMKF